MSGNSGRTFRRHACVAALAMAAVSLTTAAVAVGPAAAASPSTTAATSSDETIVGPSGNIVELVDPGQSTYIPDLAAASAADVEQAQTLLDGVNQFCTTHTAADIEATWRPGTTNMGGATHYFNPAPDSSGLDPANPKAALVYDGKVGGVMFTGKPLPYLGTIPRAHSHPMSMGVEMVHVYCTKNLQDAFTPNRTLGVLADTLALRVRIRPHVMDLTRPQLREVRAKVRGYCGDALQPVEPVPNSTGPDPVLQAMRTEIRHALMLLNEHQLRSVWELMKSYRN